MPEKCDAARSGARILGAHDGESGGDSFWGECAENGFTIHTRAYGRLLALVHLSFQLPFILPNARAVDRSISATRWRVKRQGAMRQGQGGDIFNTRGR